MDKFNEECGVFGIIGARDASYKAYQGIYALQHRGQESAGIASAIDGGMYSHKGMGLVSQVFQDFDFKRLPGDLAIAHNRYSTTGSSTLSNAQPICMECRQGMLAIAHNGNLVNASTLRRRLQEEGAIFQTSSDSEIIVHLMSRSRQKSLAGALKEALLQVRGCYCITAMASDRLIVARDPFAFRPLALGRIRDGYCVASETCAFDLIGAEYVREIMPGEILIIYRNSMKMRSLRLPKAPRRSKCIFEFIYFSRPDSVIFGQNCDKIRRRMGRQLAREDDLESADIVISVPDSSNTAALGYSLESGIPFEIGLIRNHYVGRTFIKPSQGDRELGVRVKFNPVRGVLSRKRIVLVEDSIVRGTTLKGLIRVLRTTGVKEVHVRVASPVVTAPCYFGIDLSTRKEIIGANKSVSQIRRYIGADSLRYLSLEGMLDVSEGAPEDFCVGCFGGEYPVPAPKNHAKELKCMARNKLHSHRSP
jgi:amidophosphoribosyltransferase